ASHIPRHFTSIPVHCDFTFTLRKVRIRYRTPPPPPPPHPLPPSLSSTCHLLPVVDLQCDAMLFTHTQVLQWNHIESNSFTSLYSSPTSPSPLPTQTDCITHHCTRLTSTSTIVSQSPPTSHHTYESFASWNFLKLSNDRRRVISSARTTQDHNHRLHNRNT